MNAHARLSARFSLAVALALATACAHAHCDTLDGPVVGAARKALDTGNVNFALVWVQKNDENALRAAFDKARSVRKAGSDAKSLADAYFFETLVRLHRAGEGAPYTGLKPAGHVEPPMAAADRAIASGKPEELARLISARTEKGLHTHFDAVVARKRYAPDDVEAGRAYSRAYVEFVHYAERLYDAAETLAPEHSADHSAKH